MSIRLTNAKGATQDFKSSVKDLIQIDVFVKADVIQGTWIMYREIDYNESLGHGASEDDSIVLKESSRDVAISSTNASLYHVSSDQHAMELFEFEYYGGARKSYTNQESDISKTLPKGAYCAMLGIDKDWEVYEKPGFKGPHQRLASGKSYTTPSAIGLSFVKSIDPQ